MHLQRPLHVRTNGKGAHELTALIEGVVQESGVRVGLCVITCMHTSASLVVTENADPSVRQDLLAWLDRIAPEGDPSYRHTAEGTDDMPAHLRAAVTSSSETLVVADGALALGTWQGLYLLEHRSRPHERQVLVHVHGDL